MKNILAGIRDVVFPPRCIGCGALSNDDKEPFCPDCRSLISFVRSPLCPRCGLPFSEPSDSDHVCGECLTTPPPFFLARALGRYETVLMDVIHRFKYGGAVSLGERLGGVMAEAAYPSFVIQDYSLVMPVPLHPRKLRKRGFNQALILAREISRRFPLALDFLNLKRMVDTEPQVGQGKAAREHNIKGAFAVADKEAIQGERIILVDDVYTTGGTARECASILMRNKAEAVAVLTLARTV